MINDFKDLEKFLKILRRQGVMEASLNGLTVKLGDLPEERLNLSGSKDITDPYSNFPDGDLTPEQLMFYSAGGLPEDDPYLKDKQ